MTEGVVVINRRVVGIDEVGGFGRMRLFLTPQAHMTNG
jgi:hypothetical protein